MLFLKKRSLRFSALIACVIAQSVPLFAAELVGTLPGELSVDNRGSANYSIPIEVPPGVNGMQPALLLNYSSSGGNDVLGLGWSVSTGFPTAITRGRTIQARDGSVKGITFDSTDKLYLDGKRLICVSDPDGDGDSSEHYWSLGSEYRTEVESFKIIKANEAGSSIVSFELVAKDGTRYWFGKEGSDSNAYQSLATGFVPATLDSVAYRWALRKVTDPHGNIVRLFYASPNVGEYVLDRIEYTSRETTNPISAEFRVSFAYNQSAARTDTREFAIGGRTYSLTQRLDRISVERSTGQQFGTLANYDLSYDYSPHTERLRLVSVDAEMRNSLSDSFSSLPATDFDWSNDSISGSPAHSYDIGNPITVQYDSATGHRLTAGRFDGDGKAKIASANFTTNSSEAYKYSNQVGDFDGDGIDEIAVIKLYADITSSTQLGNSEATLSVTTSGGHSLGLSFLDRFKGQLSGSSTVSAWTLAFDPAPHARVSVADFTADGRSDVMVHGHDGNLYLYESLGNGFAPERKVGDNVTSAVSYRMVMDFTASPPQALGYGPNMFTSWVASTHHSDFNGDGRLDYIFLEQIEEREKTYKTTRNEFIGDPIYAKRIGQAYNPNQTKTYFLLRELRIVFAGEDADFSSPDISLQTFPPVSTSDGSDPIEMDDIYAGFRSGDFNGDGLTDFLIKDTKMMNGAKWNMVLSRGAASASDCSRLIIGVIPNTIQLGQYEVDTYFKPVSDNVWNTMNTPSEIDSTGNGEIFQAIRGSGGFANASIWDINKDGLDDYVWYVENDINDNPLPSNLRGWYVMYSQGMIGGFHESYSQVSSFSDPERIPFLNEKDPQNATNSGLTPADDELGRDPSTGGQFYWTNHIGNGFYFNQYVFNTSLDFNGDGHSDLWVRESCSQGTSSGHIYYANHPTESGSSPVFIDRLTKVIDGLGSPTEVEYLAAKDYRVYTEGADVSYPIQNSWLSSPVVSEVYRDAGGNNGETQRYSYSYSGARTDLSGRGDLGFHSFVTYDHQTDLLSYQFLSQSFPMTGLVKREHVYRATSVVRDANGDLVSYGLLPISAQDNDVTFDEVIGTDSGSGSSYRAGTMFPFMSHSQKLSWEDNTATAFTVDVGSPEALFADYNAKHATNLTRAHSDINTYVWFDTQSPGTVSDPNALAPVDSTLPGSAYDDSSLHKPGEQDGIAKGFSDWNQAALAMNLTGSITNGNIVRTRVDYGDGFVTDSVSKYWTGHASGLTGLVHKSQTQVAVNGSTDFVGGPVVERTYDSNGLLSDEKIDAAAPASDTLLATANPNSSLTTTKEYSYTDYGQLSTTTLEADTGTGEYALPLRTVSEVTEWDSTKRFPKKAQNAYGHWTRVDLYDDWGRPEKTTNVNDQTLGVTTVYDAIGRPTSVTDNLLGHTTSTSITATAATTVPAPSGPGLSLQTAYKEYTEIDNAPNVTTYYDRLGRVIRVVKDAYGSQQAITDTIYDIAGRVVAVSNPYASGAVKYWTKTTYDDLGRVSTVTAPNNTLTTYTYKGRVSHVSVDGGGPSVAPAAQVTTSFVNARGETVKIWNADNPVGATTTTTAAGKPSLEFVHDGFGRMTQTTAYQGVLADRPSGTPEYLTTSVAYDALGSQTQLSDPDKGVWNYKYNGAGQLTWQQNAKGDQTTIGYDLIGRKIWTKVDDTDNSSDSYSRWHYYESTSHSSTNAVVGAPGSWIGALQRSEIDNGVTSFAAADHATSIAYNDKGLPRLNLSFVDGKYYYTYIDYDGEWRPYRKNYFWRPSGYENDYATQPQLWQKFGVQYHFDAESYVTKVSDSQNRTWWQVGSNGYDIYDAPVNYSKGGVQTVRTYHPADRALATINTGSGVVQNWTYTWDGLGNLKTRVSPKQGGTETFAYDELNRLETAIVTGGATRSFAYFDNGNIKSKTKLDASQPNSGTYAYGHATKKHAVTSAFGYTIGYDANGNMVSRSGNGQSWNFDWTAFDKPNYIVNGTKGSLFKYNAENQRVVHLKYDSVAGGAPVHAKSKKVYVGSQMEIDFDNEVASGSGQTWEMSKVRIYIDGPDGRTGAYELDPNTYDQSKVQKAYLYHQDHLGSIDVVTDYGAPSSYADDEDGKDSLFSYDPWGERRNPSTWNGKPSATGATSGANGDKVLTPRGYTDHEMLDDLGLVHMNGRIYDPLLGRFLSADKNITYPAMLESYNRYAYVLNNPLRYSDPNGYDPIEGYDRIHSDGGERARYVTKRLTAGGARSIGKGLAFGASAVLLSSDETVEKLASDKGMTSAEYKAEFVKETMQAVDDLVTKVTGIQPDDPFSEIGETGTDVGGLATGAAGLARLASKLAGKIDNLIDDVVTGLERLSDEVVKTPSGSGTGTLDNTQTFPNGSSSQFEDITKPGRVTNIQTDVPPSEFEANLLDSGYTKSVSKDGKVTIFQKEGSETITLRDMSKSTKAPTAEVRTDGETIMKIRLPVEDQKKF